KKQREYNKKHNIIPTQIVKRVRNVLGKPSEYDAQLEEANPLLLDPVMAAFNPSQIKEAIKAAKLQMESAAADLDFMRAAKFRDEMSALKKMLEKNN
ncbi:MAG: UvrB/UvrC motif-containing protein, partial [Bacteroidales bacterium]|nr:UvrB/UvrC motif-containing protein [Bacteroidales bacterium]